MTTIKNLEIINTKLEFFVRNPIISLTIIGVVSLIIRLYFFEPEVPIARDSFEYFRIANDLALQDLTNTNNVQIGWPYFVSILFSIVNYNNFLDYHTLQRLLSIFISVLTIIPVYFLCKKFVGNASSIVGAAMIGFEPHLIGNSLLGLSESFFILLGAIAGVFFLSQEKKQIYFSFCIIAIFTFVRAEGIILFVIFSILYFIRYRKKIQDIVKYSIIITIFLIILIPLMALSPSEHITAFDKVNEVSVRVLVLDNSNEYIFSDKIIVGLEVLTKKIAQTMIPYFIFFVPIGIFFLFKKMNFNNFSLIVILSIGLLGSLYILSRANDIRYLFWLYPFIVVLSVITVEKFYAKIRYANFPLFLIIIGLVVASSLFLVETDLTDRNREAYQFAFTVSEKTQIINDYFQDGYLDYVKISSLERFPIQSDSFPQRNPQIIYTKCCNSINEFIEKFQDQGLSHIVVDNTSKKESFLDEVFYDEKKYSFLEKIYDTNENGYLTYHAKIYVINYEKFYNED